MDKGMDTGMDTGNELSRIDDIIGDTISNFLIDDDYKIDDTLEWLELSQVYIMRYRRIIGIVILVILLGIIRYCHRAEENVLELQAGGGSAAIAAAKSAGRSSFSKAMGSVGTKFKASKPIQNLGVLRTTVANSLKPVGKYGSHLAKDTYTGEQVAKLKSAAGNALGKSKLGQFATGKMGDIKNMKSAGMSKFGVAKELTGQAGQFAADKFKEFAGWLYEILFAIAISIAICMIVVPSIAFFALGLICYFLLRKKISSIKAF
jgi:hypothetical protein